MKVNQLILVIEGYIDEANTILRGTKNIENVMIVEKEALRAIEILERAQKVAGELEYLNRSKSDQCWASIFEQKAMAYLIAKKISKFAAVDEDIKKRKNQYDNNYLFAYKQVAKYDPLNENAWHKICLYSMRDNPQESLDAFKRVIKINPEGKIATKCAKFIYVVTGSLSGAVPDNELEPFLIKIVYKLIDETYSEVEQVSNIENSFIAESNAIECLDKLTAASKAATELETINQEYASKAKFSISFARAKVYSIAGLMIKKYKFDKEIAERYYSYQKLIVSCCRDCTTMKPNHSVSWYNLGITYQLLNDTKNALKAFKEAMILGNSDAAREYHELLEEIK